ncbi:hypothetical protein AB4516_15160 [Vibrio sp. 10N.222.54.F12]|uniref:hypothetical protein n=1 Tax=Vibrio TaxID=662 RepID=UPI0002DD559F|nr:hypothetical protein [Vibrio tasmaniensis]OEF71954.1 hypothetical protein A152_13385 [Vibrio tasmaniensis 1F-187]PML16618.1 hypothetical protein BCT83_11505 [Vibrio tasmaniensis]
MVNKRTQSLKGRIELVTKTLDTYIATPGLKAGISNMDQLAKKLERDTGIGYSTLLKSEDKGGYYRGYLETALIKVAPSTNSLGSLAEPQPKNWVHQEAIYRSKIGLLNNEIKKLKIELRQAELAISDASNSQLTLQDATEIRQADINVEKLCRALARILDHEDVGLDLMPDGRIEYFGETLVNSEQTQPYLAWQARTTPTSHRG